MDLDEIKKRWKKTWNFIWHDDSLASWIVNIILAFVIIKFLVYPGLGLVFGTSFPVVAVVSESMEHEQSFDGWWQDNKDWYLKHNITRAQFEFFPFTNGFNKGDIMVLVGDEPADIELGDVIVYQAGKPYPIIHRVVDRRQEVERIEVGNQWHFENKWYFETKGDNNRFQIVEFDLDESNIPQEAVYGKAVARIPFLGYVKIWFVDLVTMISAPFRA